MSLLFFTGFQVQHDPSQTGGNTWDGDNPINDTEPANDLRAGSYALVIYGPGYWIDFDSILSGGLTTFYIGFNYKATYSGNSFRIGNADGDQLHVVVTSDGSISCRLGTTTGTELDSASAGTFNYGAWDHWEIQAKIDPAAGYIKVRINGTEVCSFTGDTQYTGSGTTVTQFASRIGGLIADAWIDDAQSHGICRIDTIAATGAGNSTSWTASSGSNYECIDELINVSTTDYIYTETLNALDTYVFGDVSGITSAIKGVGVNLHGTKEGVKTTKVSAATRVNSVDYVGSEILLDTNQKAYQYIWELNPDDSAAWEMADINAAEFGVKLTTLTS